VIVKTIARFNQSKNEPPYGTLSCTVVDLLRDRTARRAGRPVFAPRGTLMRTLLSRVRLGRCVAAAALVLAVPVVAVAADQPTDMKGRWIGKTHSIVAGSGGHWPSSNGTFEKPALFEKDLVIEGTGQDGRRFWGVTRISGSNETTNEPFIAELSGRDGKKMVVVDTDGFFNGELVDPDTVSFCYAQAGGKTSSSVVSCTEVKRAR
jgi:hypothetical protein